jgi:hypothetical protein
MFRRIIPWILVVLISITGGYFIYKFYTENKDHVSQLEDMTVQYNNAQSQLNSIGTMIDVYAISTDVLSGDEIMDTDIITVSIPEQAAGSSVVRATETTTDDDGNSVPVTADFIGKHYRCDYSKGTLLTKEMLMTDDEEAEGIQKFPVELTFNSLPVTLEVGDYVDIRFLIANGEEYVVLDHKIVRDIYNTTITLWISEEENAIINSMYSDLGVYSGACVAYLYKYLEPGNSQTLSFYPVLSELEAFLKYNPNITDVTRCVNSDLRNYIDQQLIILTDSANSGVSSSVISYVSTALSNQSSMRQNYLQEKEQAEQEAELNATTSDDSAVETTEEVDTEAIE